MSDKTKSLVAEMLGVNEDMIPPGLISLLEEMDMLLGRVKGRIVSRQILALAIVMWER